MLYNEYIKYFQNPSIGIFSEGQVAIMETLISVNGSLHFQDSDRESGHILAKWIDRCGVKSSTILEELPAFSRELGTIGPKSFQQWTSDTTSARLVSGQTPGLQGSRVVALVRWFVHEHRHRSQPVIQPGELHRFIALYGDIPVKNRLQLQRILHEFELDNRLREPNNLFSSGDWREQFAKWPVFGMVVDPLWCLRATNVCDLELVGLDEQDRSFWEWWHRLAVRAGGKTKFSAGSPFQPLRGPYADIYHQYQMARFRRVVESPEQRNNPRCHTLMSLLMETPGFRELWEKSDQESYRLPKRAAGVPIPFFRTDGTLLWMYEVSALIPGTDNYRLIVWTPVDENTSEYLAEIRKQANRPGRYSRPTFYIEDHAAHFSQEERFALGIA